MISSLKLSKSNPENAELPFFTILTASLNSGSTIKGTLESIKNQTFQNFEHIVIDGGSADATVDILQRYSGSYNLSWISEPDKGIADALNKGLSKSRGKYIIVIQADDHLLHPNILEKVHLLLKSEKTDITSFPVILNHPVKGKVLRKPIKQLWWNHFKFIFPHQGCFVNRSLFEKIGVFRNDFQIAMDYDFFYRALNHHSTVTFGEFPVAEMGGEGIGTSVESTMQRLQEEKRVQLQNENSLFWKAFQSIFRFLYLPYKKRRISN